jgi:hypothetical protein
VGRPAPADDRPALSGAWQKKDAEPRLEFVGADALTIFPHGDNVDFRVNCSYTVTKEGMVRAKVTGLDGRRDVVEKAKGALPVGLEYRFEWRVNGDAATLDGLKGEGVEHAKGQLEGEYTRRR